MEDHVEREFCSEQGQEPLGSIHVCFKADVQKVVIQIRNVFLRVKHTEALKINLGYFGTVAEPPNYRRKLGRVSISAGSCIHLA